MKRSLVWLGSLLLSVVLVGCGSETQDDLITHTLNAVNEAAKQFNTIAKNVNDAVDKAEKDGVKQLDFTTTQKPLETLEQAGMKMQRIKSELESRRGSITEEQQKENFETKRGAINEAYKRLQKDSEELTKALDKARQVNSTETQQLETKIRKAVGPFESLSRQSA